MRTKYFLLGTAALVAVAGLWFGRAVWRVHHQLVTLNVRDTPLPEVLRNIERQTWKRLRAESALDEVRITLRVTDMPLPKVLDRIAEQAGARWSTLYAVYDSARALKALDSALRGDGKLEPAGWKKLAPALPPILRGGSDQAGLPPHPAPGSADSVQAPLRLEPTEASGPSLGAGAQGPGGGNQQFLMARRGPNGPVVVFGGAEGKTEVWSPEELVASSALSAKLGTNLEVQASAPAAAAAARQLHANWTTYLAFRKSILGVGFVAPHGPPAPGQALRGPDPNERFRNLTPEQRVERARQRFGFKTSP
jgi:hypothetical protein